MKVCIVGVGLIGGSLGLALKSNGFADQIIGVDSSSQHLETARQLGLIDIGMSEDEAIKTADLIVLAAPVDALLNLLPTVLDRISHHQTVVDLGSTKELLIQQIDGYANRNRYVAAHPMAGTEYSGPSAAKEDLYQDKICVLVDTHQSAKDALDLAKQMFSSIGMKLTEMGSSEHDLHCAYVSHISHIAGFGLALTVLEKEKNEARIFELASSGFSSTARLAKSSASTWIPIFRQNRDHVLDVLDEHIEQLSRFRSLLIKKDFDTFYKKIEAANEIKRIID
ncbi:MAG: prephenate dehydrogenase [Bacteroidota bacterium]